MSRSFKKTPGFSPSEKPRIKKYWIRLMNKRIRRFDSFISNGNIYRKFIERWDFKDYNWRLFSKKQINDFYEKNEIYKIYIKWE